MAFFFTFSFGWNIMPGILAQTNALNLWRLLRCIFPRIWCNFTTPFMTKTSKSSLFLIFLLLLLSCFRFCWILWIHMSRSLTWANFLGAQPKKEDQLWFGQKPQQRRCCPLFWTKRCEAYSHLQKWNNWIGNSFACEHSWNRTQTSNQPDLSDSGPQTGALGVLWLKRELRCSESSTTWNQLPLAASQIKLAILCLYKTNVLDKNYPSVHNSQMHMHCLPQS